MLSLSSSAADLLTPPTCLIDRARNSAGHSLTPVSPCVCHAPCVLYATRFLVSISRYPGNGARYVRHVDNSCRGGGGGRCNGRRLSAVFYLNPLWESSAGGELRILRAAPEGAGELPLLDVAPHNDRLLVFWADERNPHEVLPSFAERFAVTVWYYSAAELKGVRERVGAPLGYQTHAVHGWDAGQGCAATRELARDGLG